MNEGALLSPPMIIPVSDGLVVPLYQDKFGVEVKSVEPYLEITEYGVSITVGRIIMPLSLACLQHLLDNGQTIYFYGSDEETYMATFIGEKRLDRDKLLKLVGGWEVLHGER